MEKPWLLIGGLVLVGFNVGYFLPTPALILITVVSAAVIIYLVVNYIIGNKGEGFGQIAAIAITIFLVIANLSMWITHGLKSSNAAQHLSTPFTPETLHERWLLMGIPRY